MIHYHGTPIGGQRVEAARFLFGRHCLIPWPRHEDLEVAKEACSSFIVDNGAFTIWKKGKGAIDSDAYISWVQTFCLHPAFDWALIPDVIDGTEEDNDALLKDWPTKMALGVPVYHLHESLDRADRLCGEWPIVAIGSSGEWPIPGNRKWTQRMHQVMSVMCNSNGEARCKLHGLRMMRPEIFTSYPFRSVDSTNCAQNGSRNGKVIDKKITSGQGAIITAWQIEAHQSPDRWDRSPDSSILVREQQSTLFHD